MKLSEHLAVWCKTYLWPDKPIYKFKAGQFVKFATHCTFSVDNDWGVMLYCGGKIIGEGCIRAGRRAYLLTFDPYDKLTKDKALYNKPLHEGGLRKPEVFFFEDAMLASNEREYRTLVSDLDADGAVITKRELKKRQAKLRKQKLRRRR